MKNALYIGPLAGTDKTPVQCSDNRANCTECMELYSVCIVVAKLQEVVNWKRG